MAQRTSRPPRVPPQPDVRRPGLRRSVIAVLVVALVAGAAGAAIGYAVGRPGADQVAITELRKADAKRDVQQIGELTALARATAGDLDKVLSGLAEAIPKDKTSNAKPATPVQIEEWQRTLRQAAERHAETPSGTTATNVARGGFRSAVNAMTAAVDTYAASQRLPVGVRETFADLAARQRSAAIAMWSVAATQLDQINVDAGNGHQHAYLTGTPEDGAITADEVPEGRPH
ncbi:hypothetical protein OG589_29165 [Sphaerisporangium sp. NBC_01403]|uniref:hypothetical protein n=1 Tax=Sphaerisporangium sp. NBC_01403 TaxID=2903599 RepID=UPI003248468F